MEILNLNKNNGKISLSRVFKVLNTHCNSGEAWIMALADPRVMVLFSWGGDFIASILNLAPKNYHDGETYIALAERKINCFDGCYSATFSPIYNEWYVSTFNGIKAFLHSEPSIS